MTERELIEQLRVALEAIEIQVSTSLYGTPYYGVRYLDPEEFIRLRKEALALYAAYKAKEEV